MDFLHLENGEDMIIIKFSTIQPKQEEEFFEAVNPAYLSGVVNWELASSINKWNPPYDLLETEFAYIIRVEIAGMHEDDFEVSLDSHHVLIRGTREDDMDSFTFHQMEIPFGEFSFKVDIPGPVQAAHVIGEYANGFLTITLPKQRKSSVLITSSDIAD